MIIKLFIIIFLVVLIYLFSKKNEKFQSQTFPVDLSIDLEPESLGGSPDYYSTIDSNERSTSLDIDTNFQNDSMNINVGNSIISENNLQINGRDIDIKALRYIKKIPIHYQKEICLSDPSGKIECINKEQIDILKGVRPFQLITYPNNYRKCLEAVDKKFLYNISGNNIDNAKIFSANDCTDGLKHQHFKINRDHDHNDRQSHYHIHGIDKNMHAHQDGSRDANYIDSSLMSPFEDVGPIGISEAVLPMSEGGLGIGYNEALLLDNDPQDNQLTSNELADYLGVSIGDPYQFTIDQAILPVVEGGLGLTREEAQAMDTNNDGTISRDEMQS